MAGLRTRVSGPDFDGLETELEREVAGFVTGAMQDTVLDVLEAFRAQVRAAGLGNRLPGSIRGVTYPERKNSLEPAGWVYAQPAKNGRGAAAIIDSYLNGANIVPTGGRRYLAIPTEDTPRNRNGSAMSPEQVEDKFGRRLVLIDGRDRGFKTPSKRRQAVGFLVLKNLVVRKSTSRWRNPTKREKEGRSNRQLQAIIMFVLVRAVKKPQSLDLTSPQSIAVTRFEANLNARWR